MPYRRYRPHRQFGIHDTHTFKMRLRKHVSERMPVFELPKAVQASDVRIYESSEPELFSRQIVQDERKQAEQNLKAIFSNYQPNTPKNMVQSLLNKEFAKTHGQPAYVFQAEEPLCDGVDQASILSNAIVRETLPDWVMKNVDEFDIPEEYVRDSILHGEKYDPTLEKLPIRHDPIIFWIRHPRVFGTPVVKRGNTILDNLFRQVYFAGRRNGKLQGLIVKRDPWISAYTESSNLFGDRPFVLRFRPHVLVESENADIPQLRPWLNQVEEASKEPLPDIYPISPLVDLQTDKFYHDYDGANALLTGIHKDMFKDLNPELLKDLSKEQLERLGALMSPNRNKSRFLAAMWCCERNQKYPWTTEQHAANAILHTYGLALAEANRRFFDLQLAEKALASNPIIMRGAQLFEGKLDLVTIQLNTMHHNSERKNFVWLQRALPLYKPRPYYEEMHELGQVEMGTMKKFTALIAGHPPKQTS
ncbi:hypothetical protein WR25_03532 isoform A [Diploscapter pachys]|uniref:39S ribosomal protein L37, mitochondrial n=1 Tax=Diploscapter pachys TaxID=2018661 RepID=A0A2A2JCB8_9BILA|nr:hypothetical protein WR25_03532 isoform A [Diploscapter pachys]